MKITAEEIVELIKNMSDEKKDFAVSNKQKETEEFYGGDEDKHRVYQHRRIIAESNQGVLNELLAQIEKRERTLKRASERMKDNDAKLSVGVQEAYHLVAEQNYSELLSVLKRLDDIAREQLTLKIV